MRRLVLVVRGGGKEYERDPIARRQVALARPSIRRGVLIQALQGLVVRMIGERPGELAEGDGLERRVGEPEPKTAAKSRPDIAHRVKLTSPRDSRQRRSKPSLVPVST